MIEHISLQLAEHGILNPRTGEVVGPDADDTALVELLAMLAEAKRRVDVLQVEVSQWLLPRMDERRSWTLEAAGFKATAASPAAGSEYDVDALEGVLGRMVEDGRLAESARAACFRTRVEVAARGLTAVISGSSPEERDEIAACQKASGRVRRVSIR